MENPFTDPELMPLLIGLNGFKGAGKDTVGDILTDNYGFKCFSFAYKVKQALATLLDINAPVLDSWKNDPYVRLEILSYSFDTTLPRVLKSLTIREALQRMGTEIGREMFGEDFWVDQILPYKDASTANADLRYHGNRAITDARFENELHRIIVLGGYNWRIERPSIEGESHASEQKPPDWCINYTIQNDGNLGDLEYKVADAVNATLRMDRQRMME